jgi:hypothetical protein
MKNGIIFTIFLGLIACSREVPFKEPAIQAVCKTAVEKSADVQVTTNAQTIENIKVIDWGPQSTTLGVNPNAQPGGELGIWMRLSSTKELGEVQVIFNGQPAVATPVVDDGLITAAVATNQLRSIGKKDVTLLQTQTKKTIQVGVFTISSN